MKWLNAYRMRLWLVGFVAALVFGGVDAKAKIIVGKPTNPGPLVNNDRDVQECDISHDGLELYYAANRTGGYGSYDLWVARRETINDPWQEPVNLGPLINTSEGNIEPSISGAGLELYFTSTEDWYTRVSKRPSKDAPWGNPTILTELGRAWRPDISFDGLTLYVESDRGGGYGGSDIWMATRLTKDDPWGEPVNLGPKVNSSGHDYCPCISTDGLTLLFDRGYRSIWGATRKSINDDWGPAVQLDFKNPPGNFFGPSLSPDGSTVYFEATPAWGGYGNNDILQAEFIPIVDFNGDEIVDAADMCILVDNWHTNNTLCDIAPLPLGDGYVDVKDLTVLAENLFQEQYDSCLIAYYKFDEAEGLIAADSTGENDGALLGGPVWQPEGGQVGGALQLDGVDDCVIASFNLNPADGSFSVFAWVKGGAPGQVILSQAGAANWQMADSANGALRTDLKEPGTTGRDPKASGPPLISPTVVTDGNWHRVGFVRDGISRTLYVDDIQVARDTAVSLEAAGGDLYIGAGSGLGAGTFWSGLIDDVRIYNQAVSP